MVALVVVVVVVVVATAAAEGMMVFLPAPIPSPPFDFFSNTLCRSSVDVFFRLINRGYELGTKYTTVTCRKRGVVGNVVSRQRGWKLSRWPVGVLRGQE